MGLEPSPAEIAAVTPDLRAPTAASARAWAREMRAIRAALGRAIAAGRLSTALAAPASVLRVLMTVLDQVDRLPADGAVADLPATRDPAFGAWAHYHRAVRAWIEGLIESAAIPEVREPAAVAFERWLLDLAAIPDTGGTAT